METNQIRVKIATNAFVLAMTLFLCSCNFEDKNPFLPLDKTGEDFYKHTVPQYYPTPVVDEPVFGRLPWLAAYHFTGMLFLNREIVNQRLAARQYAIDNFKGKDYEKVIERRSIFEERVVNAYEALMMDFDQYMLNDYISELQKLDGKELQVNLIKKGLNGATATAHLTYVKDPDTLKEGAKDWIGRHNLYLVVEAKGLNDSPMSASFVNCENNLTGDSHYIAGWFDNGEITKRFLLSPRFLSCSELYIGRDFSLESIKGAEKQIIGAYSKDKETVIATSPFNDKWQYSNHAKTDDELVECVLEFFSSTREMFSVRSFGYLEEIGAAATQCTAFTEILSISDDKIDVKGFEGRYGNANDILQYTFEYLPNEDRIKLKRPYDTLTFERSK